MKFLCDVHISYKIATAIQQAGYTAEHVNDLPDRWHTPDQAIAAYANQHDLILLTKDKDFRNSFLLNRRPKKLIKINLGNVANQRLSALIVGNLPQLDTLSAEASSFMVEVTLDGFWTVTR